MDDPPTSEQWLIRAVQASILAETMRDTFARSEMLRIAAVYERLAGHAPVPTEAVASATSTDIFHSANGDRWRLISDAETGRRFVRHEANPASGGQATETPVEEFLAVDGPGPEYEALRRIIGSSGAA
jgi:hypothetical protein